MQHKTSLTKHVEDTNATTDTIGFANMGQDAPTWRNIVVSSNTKAVTLSWKQKLQKNLLNTEIQAIKTSYINKVTNIHAGTKWSKGHSNINQDFSEKEKTK